MGDDRVEHTREGISVEGFEGDFGEEGLPSCIYFQLKYLHRWSVRNLLWQLIPVRDYSSTERVLAATGFTPLLVNLESTTAKPKAGGAAKPASYGKSRRPCTPEMDKLVKIYRHHITRVTKESSGTTSVAIFLFHVSKWYKSDPFTRQLLRKCCPLLYLCDSVIPF